MADTRYLVRLEATDGSDHYRETYLTAPDEDTARLWCERREQELVAFDLSAERLAELQAADSGDLTPRDRAELAANAQTEPYAIVSVTEV